MMVDSFVKQIVDMYNDASIKDDYPESYDLICNVVTEKADGDFEIDANLFELACNLHDADGAKQMHAKVAEFCLEIYFEEYIKGNADAALNLGSLYYTGRAGEQNYAKAVEYYTFAAEKGSLIASENLGYCYLYGRDVEKDYEKAFKYFLKGALSGHIISLYKIGDFYKNGYYIDKDESEAFRIYSLCESMLDDDNIKLAGADVLMRLGECLYKGIGTKPDIRTALFMYQTAERMYYDRLEKGDFMIKRNLDRVIEVEDEIRQKIRNSMPDRTVDD